MAPCDWYEVTTLSSPAMSPVRYARSTHDLSRTGELWPLVDRLGPLRQWFSYWLPDSSGTKAAMQP